jgi:hypothetical protein
MLRKTTFRSRLVDSDGHARNDFVGCAHNAVISGAAPPTLLLSP